MARCHKGAHKGAYKGASGSAKMRPHHLRPAKRPARIVRPPLESRSAYRLRLQRMRSGQITVHSFDRRQEICLPRTPFDGDQTPSVGHEGSSVASCPGDGSSVRIASSSHRKPSSGNLSGSAKPSVSADLPGQPEGGGYGGQTMSAQPSILVTHRSVEQRRAGRSGAPTELNEVVKPGRGG